MREALETQAGIARLGRMVGTRSMKKAMDREERMVAAENQVIHRELHDGEDLPGTGAEEDAMEIMAARDVHVTYGQPAAVEPPGSVESAPAAESPPAKSLLQKAAPLLLVTALVGPPLGALTTYFATRSAPTPPAVSSPTPGYEYSGRKYTLDEE